jgi:cyanate permease
MLIGFGLCIPYLFDALNTTLTPIIYDSTHSISLPWYIASGMDLLAVIAALMVSRIVRNK